MFWWGIRANQVSNWYNLCVAFTGSMISQIQEYLWHSYETLCTIWYHLHNLRNMKNTYEEEHEKHEKQVKKR